MENELTKEALVDLTVKLLNEGLDPERITVRLISQRAGVGVGLINYHFKTKDNLINIAVQKHINSVIARVPAALKENNISPKDRLKGVLKSTLDYLANFPIISRVSILRDYKAPNKDDNTQNTLRAYEHLARKTFGEKDFIQKTMVLIFTCQNTFLRADVIKKEGGFDFFDKSQRDIFAEKLIDTLSTGCDISE